MRRTYFATVFTPAVTAVGIIYRDDVNASLYRPPRTDFPMAFPWPKSGDGSACGATMISPQHAITAAHCLQAVDNSPFKIEVGGKDYTVIERRPNDCFDLTKGVPVAADVAILVLDSPIDPAVKGVDYVDIWDVETTGDMIGETMTMVGWGGSGPISSNDNENQFQYDVFHRGENVVNSIKDNMLLYTFDEQGQGGLPLEALGYSGDSGSGAYIQVNGEWQIAGVKAQASCCGYGADGSYTRLGDMAYGWIQDNIKFNGSSPAPRVEIPQSECTKPGGWYDPSNDGTDWQEMFNEWDKSPRDNRISLQEFTTLYNDYGCSNEGAQAMFNRIDTSNNGRLSVPEFKAAWEYFDGNGCENFGEQGGDDEEEYNPSDYSDEEDDGEEGGEEEEEQGGEEEGEQTESEEEEEYDSEEEENDSEEEEYDSEEEEESEYDEEESEYDEEDYEESEFWEACGCNECDENVEWDSCWEDCEECLYENENDEEEEEEEDEEEEDEEEEEEEEGSEYEEWSEWSEEGEDNEENDWEDNYEYDWEDDYENDWWW